MKPVRDLLVQEVTSGLWVDPFAGKTALDEICPYIKLTANDINPKSHAHFSLDALKFLQLQCSDTFDGAVLDWPYNLNQYRICYHEAGLPVNKDVYNARYQSQVKNHLARIIKKGGTCISFGWNTMGLGKNRGFEVTRILLITHGRMHNDTLVTVEVKVQ